MGTGLTGLEWGNVAPWSRWGLSPGLSNSRVPALLHSSCIPLSKLLHHKETQCRSSLNGDTVVTTSQDAWEDQKHEKVLAQTLVHISVQ